MRWEGCVWVSGGGVGAGCRGGSVVADSHLGYESGVKGVNIWSSDAMVPRKTSAIESTQGREYQSKI